MLLSRAPVEDDNFQFNFSEVNLLEFLAVSEQTRDRLVSATKEDKDLQKLIKLIKQGFSSKHKLHLPSKLFGVFDFFKIDHSISGVNPLFFKHQNCFDSVVWCFRCLWEKVNLWLEYLSSHFVEVNPI